MTLKITLLKYFDAIIGRMMASFLSEPIYINESKKINSFLVIRPGGIGDAALLIPALNILRSYFPKATLTVLAEVRNAGVFALCPVINHVLCYDKLTDLWNILCGRYDCVIDTEQSHYLSAVIARIINAPLSIGFSSNSRCRLFTHGVIYSHDRYEIFSFFDLLRPLNIAMVDIVPKRFLKISDVARKNILKQIACYQKIRFITIFPGASIVERRWGEEKFYKLSLLLHQIGFGIVVIGGMAEQVTGEYITDNGQIGLNMAGKTSLSETAAIIDFSSLLVTADSGMLHIAVGLNKATVSLFGPGRHKKWAGQDEVTDVVLNKHLACSPCTTFGTTPKCSNNASCMNEITVEEVFSAIMQSINEKR